MKITTWGPSPGLTALPHPTQALVSEIPGHWVTISLQLRELPELSHSSWRLQEETLGGRRRRVMIKNLPRSHELSLPPYVERAG